MLKKYLLLLSCSAFINARDINSNENIIFYAFITNVKTFEELAPHIYSKYRDSLAQKKWHEMSQHEMPQYEMRGTLQLIESLQKKHAIDVTQYRLPNGPFFKNTNNQLVNLDNLDKNKCVYLDKSKII
jgi:hypothetical protein